MATIKENVASTGAVIKDFVAALRDVLLFLLFVLLLFSPATINNRLVAAGFTKGNIGGLEWEAQIKTAAEQTKTVGQTVDQASNNYDKLIERLGELEKRVADPAVRDTVRDIGTTAEASRAELNTADRAVKRSLAVQQQIVEKINPGSVTDLGWIYVGKVTEQKNAWAPGSPQTVNSTNAPPAIGARLTVRDDAYLRADGASNARSTAAVLGVAKVGDTVEVLDIDFSHARGGGWFVWSKVRRVNS